MSSDSETLGSDISANQCPKAKEAVDFDSNCCGICLLEDDRAIRGWVDSCDHYFCFVCIMEWAKVESRCPMCKRRFSTIRRPPKPGVFPSERIVNVPVRDQAYHHFGNVTTGPSDPYAEVDCGICHGTADESFLLIWIFATQIQINSPKTHTQGKKRKYPSTKKNKQTNKKFTKTPQHYPRTTHKTTTLVSEKNNTLIASLPATCNLFLFFLFFFFKYISQLDGPD